MYQKHGESFPPPLQKSDLSPVSIYVKSLMIKLPHSVQTREGQNVKRETEREWERVFHLPNYSRDYSHTEQSWANLKPGT